MRAIQPRLLHSIALAAVFSVMLSCPVWAQAGVDIGEPALALDPIGLAYEIPVPSNGSLISEATAPIAPSATDPRARQADELGRALVEAAIISRSPVDPLAPSVTTTIEGIDFDGDASLTGFYHIPPDPIGAAGPGHVVHVINTSIFWATKGDTGRTSQALATFFAPLSPVNNGFDPKVLYDQFEDRFVVVTLERQDTSLGDPVNSSRILVAVSDDSDPNGTWYYLAINSMINIGGTDSWADYPGLAVCEEAVYITNNMFGFASGPFTGARLWIINKTPFYSGGSATWTIHDPSTAVSQSATTAQPAHIFGTAPTGVGTWLVRYSGYTDGTNESLSIIRVDDPLGTPAFSHQFVGLGDIENTALSMPNAPQLGSATEIETNDRRALHAVWRNDELYASTTIVPGSGPDANQATAHWCQVDTSTLAALSLSDQGDIGGEDVATGAHTFFPSIAVNSNDSVAVGFAASASTIYAGAYYTTREAADPAGTMSATATLATGLGPYVRTFGGPRNRWGDYSGMEVDPSDDTTFWVFNEYALTQGTAFGGEDGRWGTRFGRFSTSPAILVTSPNGGESWEAGAIHDITWNASNIPGNVKIWLFKGGAKVRVLRYTVAASAGSWSWWIPGDEPLDSDYSIKVVSKSDSTVFDFSDADFSITTAPIEITVPNGGESWEAGTFKDITWNAPTVGGNLKIILFKNWAKIRVLRYNAAAGAGSWTWYIPGDEPLGSDYRIKIVEKADSNTFDFSDADFTIAPAPLALTSPNGGESWQRGTVQNITWTSTGVTGNAKILLFKGGLKVRVLQYSVPVADASWTWSIPAGETIDSDYTIKILSLTDPNIVDFSDADFSIIGP